MAHSPKNILLLGTTYPFRGGGIATFNERLARQLIAEGHKVTIFTFSLQYPSFLFPGKTQMSEEAAPTDLDIHIKVNSVNPLNWIKVGKEIRALAPDILLMKFWIPFIGPSLGTIARKARKNGKTKAIAIVDNMIPHERRPGDMQLIRYFANSVDGFIAMSHSVEEDIHSFETGKKVVFAVHPVYDNFGERYDKAEAKRLLNLDADTDFLLFFGFIRDYKGLDIALEAMADPRLKGRKVKLLVAGEFYGDPKPYLDLIERLGIQDKVELRTDFIPNDQVGRYFCAADAVVQPYKTATQSGVTQVAYYFDKPMIVTNVGGLAEIVPDGKVGFVTEVSPKAIADAIFRFYDEHLEGPFAAAVAEERSRYQWDRFTAEILKLADEIQR